jgi:hypothetical protein
MILVVVTPRHFLNERKLSHKGHWNPSTLGGSSQLCTPGVWTLHTRLHQRTGRWTAPLAHDVQIDRRLARFREGFFDGERSWMNAAVGLKLVPGWTFGSRLALQIAANNLA